MTIAELMAAEAQHEGGSTRKVLERVPVEHLGWKPHDKSMTLQRLAAHVAELGTWGELIVAATELDFAKSEYKPWLPTTREALLEGFDRNQASLLKALEGRTDGELGVPWSLRSGAEVYFTLPRHVVLRSMVLNHVVHHRGQLTVYLRLLGVPVPGVYGPTADEQAM